MHPGPYSVCRFQLTDDDSDGVTYITLRYGYDTLEQAWRAVPALSAEFAIDEEEICVVRAFSHGAAE